MAANNTVGHQPEEMSAYENHNNHDGLEHYLDADGEPLPSLPESHRTDGILTENPINEHEECSEEQDEKMAHLIELNTTLAEELASLRSWKVEMEEQARKMEKDIKKMELETSILDQERTQWLAEKQAFASEKKALELALSESKSAENQNFLLKSEIQRLSDEHQKLVTEKDALKIQLSASQREYSELLLHNKAIENELTCILDACAAADLQVGVANKIIEDLGAEVVSLTESKERSERQLDVSLQRISSLEEHITDLVFGQQEVGVLVQNLESDLEAARSAHKAAVLSFEQEKGSNTSLLNVLEAAHSKTRGLEKNMESLQVSFLTVQGDALKYKQQISYLEGKISALLEEKMSLEKAKTAMQFKIEMLNSTSEEVMADGKRKLDECRKQVEFLKSSIVCAKQETVCSNHKILQLKTELELVRECLYKKTKFAPYMLPVAVVSTGALAIAGMVAFLKQSRNQ